MRIFPLSLEEAREPDEAQPMYKKWSVPKTRQDGLAFVRRPAIGDLSNRGRRIGGRINRLWGRYRGALDSGMSCKYVQVEENPIPFRNLERPSPYVLC
jgi:hypothetical protein